MCVFVSISPYLFVAFSALDDFELKPGRCISGGTTAQPPLSTPTPDPELTCDFEDGTMCGWVQSLGDGGDWMMSTGDVMNSNLGPLVDHTTHLSPGKYFIRQ